jgi:hypothetical protein
LNKKWDEDKDLLYSEVTGAEIEKVIKLLKKEVSWGRRDYFKILPRILVTN